MPWLISIIIIILLLIITNIRVVPQASSYVIERLGAFQSAWSVGLHFKIPLIDRGKKSES